jgi:hypothetical protein
MKVLFAGPSLAKGSRDLQQLPAIIVRGPAARGDVARAALEGANAIGIVDGVFEDTMSVWHKEILFALFSGIAVGGAASMGALRAAECAAFGMVGIGSVCKRYQTGDLTDDADVAQIHAPAELGYQPLSEPWVNIEPTLDKMKCEGLITIDELQALSKTARQLHFKERTYCQILESASLMSIERRQKLLAWVSVNAVDQKRIDALELVSWLVAQPDRRTNPPDWQFSKTTHWLALLNQINLGGRFCQCAG